MQHTDVKCIKCGASPGQDCFEVIVPMPSYGTGRSNEPFNRTNPKGHTLRHGFAENARKLNDTEVVVLGLLGWLAVSPNE